jgi:hypothetical protein
MCRYDHADMYIKCAGHVHKMCEHDGAYMGMTTVFCARVNLIALFAYIHVWAWSRLCLYSCVSITEFMCTYTCGRDKAHVYVHVRLRVWTHFYAYMCGHDRAFMHIHVRASSRRCVDTSFALNTLQRTCAWVYKQVLDMIALMYM